MDKPPCILGRLRGRNIDMGQDLITKSNKSSLSKEEPPQDAEAANGTELPLASLDLDFRAGDSIGG